MTRITIPALIAASLLVACAHDPSKELVAARSTYEEAENGPAGNMAKAEVYEAKKALTQAERAHDRKSGSGEEIDLSYVALRKADYAIAFAHYLQYEKQTEMAKAAYLSTLESQKDRAEGQLESTQGQLDAKSKQLEAQVAARKALEAQLTAAMASLSDMAKFKQEDQRTIITLNGAVLFRSDDTNLLPIAQEKLAQVAEVLKQYGEDYTMTVVGHTDSRGTDSHNTQLSQGRADAVKNYLVSKGVTSAGLTSKGMGEAQPVSDNKTAEGRANNRRVEIIVDRKPEAK
jgi:outer membrane protein OmpA-like peptidoglycan-associated protein